MKTPAELEAFAHELHALCERHGLYLRGAYPAAAPIVYERYGDEKGFDIKPPFFIDEHEGIKGSIAGHRQWLLFRKGEA